MKKTLLLGAMALMCLSFAMSCDKDDSSDPNAPAFDSTSEFNEKYGVNLTNVFTKAQYKTNGDYDIPSNYTPATDAQVLAVANYLEKYVFTFFDDSLIANHMPINMYVADGVTFTAYDEVVDAVKGWADSLKKGAQAYTLETSSTDSTVIPMYGEVSNNHITFAANMLKDQYDTTLVMNWLSLVVERILGNTEKFAAPDEFVKLSEDAHDVFFTSSFMKKRYNIYSAATAAKGDTKLMPTNLPTSDPFFVWWHDGVLNTSRYGYYMSFFYTQNDADLWNAADPTASSKYTAFTSKVYMTDSWQKDFGDYFAFIVCTTATQKADFYAKVDAAKCAAEGFVCTGKTGDSSIMKQKVELVKAYVKANFGFDIVDAPAAKLQLR